MKTICDVYKSVGHDEMYLYVKKSDGLERVPAGLLEKFGPHKHALTFVLTSDRRLAKEDPALVLANLEENGFHLQLPPHRKGMLGSLTQASADNTRDD